MFSTHWSTAKTKKGLWDSSLLASENDLRRGFGVLDGGVVLVLLRLEQRVQQLLEPLRARVATSGDLSSTSELVFFFVGTNASVPGKPFDPVACTFNVSQS